MFSSVADSTLFSVQAGRETGRNTLKSSWAYADSVAGGSMGVLDTVLFRTNDQGVWAGNGYSGLSWKRDSADLVWRWWARTSGLGASDPSIADHAWLEEAIQRWRMPTLWGVHWALEAGILAEHQDTGSASIGLGEGEDPARSAASGLWGGEAAWKGGSDVVLSLDGFALEDAGDGRLRLTRRGANAALATSISGDKSDSLRLWAGWDTLRQRSEHLLVDRLEGKRQLGAAWSLPAGRQTWIFDGGWQDATHDDLTGRSRGSDIVDAYGDVDFAGPLRWGFSHHQRLQRSVEDRFWNTLPTGDSASDSAQGVEDDLDRDRTNLLQLSDTLRWTTSRWGGWTASAGAVQSLRRVRHPRNKTPSSSDRPDEDLSRRSLTLSVFSAAWGWKDRPLATWTTLSQQDVFPRSVQSIRTTSRKENRFSIDLDPPVSRLVRPLGGVWGREQRNLWRFDSSKATGLLEEGWSAGLEVGPRAQPWCVVRWVRWRVWTGALAGQDFAPDLIQDDWAPELSGTVVLRDSLLLRPWARVQLERISSWDSTWNSEVRNENGRAGMDLSSSWKKGSIRLSAGWEWNDPGRDGWTGSLSGQVRW